METTEPIVNNESDESVEQVDENGLRPDFKEAMDSYEAFIDKYVEFMETYDENDVSMMMKYLALIIHESSKDKNFLNFIVEN